MVSVLLLTATTSLTINSERELISNDMNSLIASETDKIALNTKLFLENKLIIVDSLAKNPLTIRLAENASILDPLVLWDSYEGANWDNEQNQKNNKSKIAWNASNDLDPDFSEYINSLQLNNQFSEFFILESRGLIFSSSISIPGDFVNINETWWNLCVNSPSGSYNRFVFDESTNSYNLEIIKEIRNSTNARVGMIKAGLNMNAVQFLLFNSLTDQETGFGVDSKGNILIHSNGTLIGDTFEGIVPKEFTENQILINKAMNGSLEDTGLGVIIVNGVKILIGYQKIEGWDVWGFYGLNEEIYQGYLQESNMRQVTLALL